jgi:hypothetical protein
MKFMTLTATYSHYKVNIGRNTQLASISGIFRLLSTGFLPVQHFQGHRFWPLSFPARAIGSRNRCCSSFTSSSIYVFCCQQSSAQRNLLCFRGDGAIRAVVSPSCGRLTVYYMVFNPDISHNFAKVFLGEYLFCTRTQCLSL